MLETAISLFGSLVILFTVCGIGTAIIMYLLDKPD